MRQAIGKMLKNYLADFTDEITFCKQIIDKEALLALKESFNMNIMLGRKVGNKNLATYDELVEMLRIAIINEEMIDH